MKFDNGGRWQLAPAKGADTTRVLYVYEGQLRIGDQLIEAPTGVVVEAGQAIDLVADSSGAQVVMLQGRPIGEPVAQYGPFVMNDRAGIEQAFRDYERTKFGGWPWPSDDPVHPHGSGRFAIHPDGTKESPVDSRNVRS